MMMQNHLNIHPEVAQALATGLPVVALESTIIAHGMPHPENLETAQALDQIIRSQGVVPAIIAVAEGKIQVGCDDQLLQRLATEEGVLKVSRRDMGMALAGGELGATTVSGTLIGAHLAGIRVFATGGIGGVHRGVGETWDISADIPELAQSQVAVVSAGAKSILDLPKTLEALETAGVPVIGWGTDEFPAFFTEHSGISLVHSTRDPNRIARAMLAQWGLGLQGGFLIANPISSSGAANADEIERATQAGIKAAGRSGISGKAMTPFLLDFIQRHTDGKSLAANRALVKGNAEVGASIAKAYASVARG
ncbi:MAG: pseudouridine-5'-phosphate glycosidase [Flavobacteriales bacterium]